MRIGDMKLIQNERNVLEGESVIFSKRIFIIDSKLPKQHKYDKRLLFNIQRRMEPIYRL